MKEHLAFFLRRRMVGGGRPSTWNYGSTGPPLEQNRWFWTDNRS